MFSKSPSQGSFSFFWSGARTIAPCSPSPAPMHGNESRQKTLRGERRRLRADAKKGGQPWPSPFHFTDACAR
jgi:hypothetical protein